jgi:hypothetical protein
MDMLMESHLNEAWGSGGLGIIENAAETWVEMRVGLLLYLS